MKIYDTMKRKEVELTSPDGEIGMYVCGPTVYDFSHLGHARSEIVFDMVRRYLEYRGFKVKYVHNITDVDDKIINKAKEEGKTPEEIAEKFTNEYFADMQALGIKKADAYPKATENIAGMITLVKGLVEKGVAYVTSTGVYFEVKKFEGYGKLSKQNLEELESGSRVCVDEEKRDPLDFALWKFSKPGEPKWPSPWGEGRPGWHIECSVMSSKYLKRLDIHGGGKDLVFPHHENELAQSEAHSGKEFSRYWMHNGFININKEKMSKSLGNFITIRSILEKFEPDAVRLFVLNTHYRGPINFEDGQLEQASEALERLRNSLALANEYDGDGENVEFEGKIGSYKTRFVAAMDNDFNTPLALAELFNISREMNTHVEAKDVPKESVNHAAEVLAELAGALGINLEKKTDLKKIIGLEKVCGEFGVEFTNPEEVLEKMIELRNEARKKKEFGKSDSIRSKLAEIGVILEDKKEGVRWKLK